MADSKSQTVTGKSNARNSCHPGNPEQPLNLAIPDHRSNQVVVTGLTQIDNAIRDLLLLGGTVNIKHEISLEYIPPKQNTGNGSGTAMMAPKDTTHDSKPANPSTKTVTIARNGDAQVLLKITGEPKQTTIFIVSWKQMEKQAKNWRKRCNEAPIPASSSDGRSNKGGNYVPDNGSHIPGTVIVNGIHDATLEALHHMLDLLHDGKPRSTMPVQVLALFGELTAYFGAESAVDTLGSFWADKLNSDNVDMRDAAFAMYIARRYKKESLWKLITGAVLIQCSVDHQGKWRDPDGRSLRSIPNRLDCGINNAFDSMKKQRQQFGASGLRM